MLSLVLIARCSTAVHPQQPMHLTAVHDAFSAGKTVCADTWSGCAAASSNGCLGNGPKTATGHGWEANCAATCGLCVPDASCSLRSAVHVLARNNETARSDLRQRLNASGFRNTNFVDTMPPTDPWQASIRRLPEEQRALAQKKLSIFLGRQELFHRASLETGSSFLFEEDVELVGGFCEQARRLLDVSSSSEGGGAPWGDVAYLGCCFCDETSDSLTVSGAPTMRSGNLSAIPYIACPTGLLVSPEGAATARAKLEEWGDFYLRRLEGACLDRFARGESDVCWEALKEGPDVSLGILFPRLEARGVVVRPSLVWQSWQRDKKEEQAVAAAAAAAALLEGGTGKRASSGLRAYYLESVQ